MIEVLPTSEFVAQVKHLRRKYPHIRQDVQPLVDQLEAGETPGDRLQGLTSVAYKVRLYPAPHRATLGLLKPVPRPAASSYCCTTPVRSRSARISAAA